MHPVYAFAKKVKEPSILKKDITDPRDISKLGEVVARLEALPRVAISGMD